MRDRILVESVKIDRTPDPKRNPLPLAEDIRDNGQKHPILVTSKFELIDGLARIVAIQALGYVTVDAVITDDFEEAANVLHELEISSTVRQWEIIQWLDPMAQARTSVLRKRTALERMAAGEQKTARDLWNWALGLNTEVWRRLNQRADEGSELAQELVKKVNDGEATILSARHTWDLEESRVVNRQDTYAAVDQEHLLTVSARQLTAAMKGLEKIGMPITVAPAQLNPLLKQLAKARGELAGLIRKIERNRLIK